MESGIQERLAEFIRRKIGSVINDPVVRDKLTPKGHPFAARRPSVDSGYFKTFNRPNVELVDISETPIVSFTRGGLRTTDAEREQHTERSDGASARAGFDHEENRMHRVAPPRAAQRPGVFMGGGGNAGGGEAGLPSGDLGGEFRLTIIFGANGGRGGLGCRAGRAGAVVRRLGRHLGARRRLRRGRGGLKRRDCRRGEATDQQPEAETQLPEELRDGRDALPERARFDDAEHQPADTDDRQQRARRVEVGVGNGGFFCRTYRTNDGGA